MQRRINVSLSEDAVKLLDRLAPAGDRSRFLDALVKRTARAWETLPPLAVFAARRRLMASAH